MRAETLTISVAQLISTDHPEKNIKQIESLLADAPRTDLVCLPENALFLRTSSKDPVEKFTTAHPSIQTLVQWAKKHQSAVHIGSVPLFENEKMFNTSVLLWPDGRVDTTYRKIHLFDVDVEGHRSMRESDVFTHGSEPYVFDYRGWKFGSSICYDLRFSELYSRYASASVDVILIPAAFLVPTGEAHWHVMLRARAIETQAYVVASAQGGRHVGLAGTEHNTFGHAMVVGPWGEVDWECVDSTKASLKTLNLSYSRIEKVRKQIPMQAHRRLGRT